MIIKYPDGRTVEAALLARDGNSMRVALQDGQDVVEFIDAQGTWLSECLETVEIIFEWQRRLQPPDDITDESFICAPELADHLIRLLSNPGEEEMDRRPKHMTAGRIM
jgi:hypothetical protein